MADTAIKTVTGLLGGSFNPVHKGHVGLALQVAEKADVDGVWLSLSPSSPFKQHKSMLPDQVRLRMLYAATARYDSLHVTDVELSLPHPSYTIDALRELAWRYPARLFRLIIGSDNIEKFDRWYRWEEIAGDFGLIIYPRPGYEFDMPGFMKPYSGNITMLDDMEEYDVSSTEIRKRLAEGKPLDGLMDSGAEAILRDYLECNPLSLRDI